MIHQSTSTDENTVSAYYVMETKKVDCCEYQRVKICSMCVYSLRSFFFAWRQILVTIVVENCKEREERLASLYLPVPVSFVDPAGTLLGEDEFVAEVDERGEVIQHILTLVQVYLEQHGPVRSLLHSFRKTQEFKR